jgi:hypothetical protein
MYGRICRTAFSWWWGRILDRIWPPEGSLTPAAFILSTGVAVAARGAATLPASAVAQTDGQTQDAQTRARVTVRITAERDRQFTAQCVAFKLGRELRGRGYGVTVELLGGDNPHDVARRRRQMRVVR